MMKSDVYASVYFSDDGLIMFTFLNVTTWPAVDKNVFTFAIKPKEILKTVKYFAGKTAAASTGVTESVNTLFI